MSRRYLTKSRFTLAMECPTKLFYLGKDSIYRNRKKEDSFLDALAEGGFQVGKMAKMLYPHGIEVTERGSAEALKRTKELLLQHENITIFEPAFEYSGLLVRVDILVKRGNQVELIEVKAKSHDSENPKIAGRKNAITSEMRPYIEDVAFQRFVVASAMPGVNVSCFLMMPDKAICAEVDGLNQCFKIRRLGDTVEISTRPGCADSLEKCKNLLAKVPVDEFVSIVTNGSLSYPGSKSRVDTGLRETVMRWAAAYSADEKISPTIHKNCAKCEFREVPGGHLKSGYEECLMEAFDLTAEDSERGTVLDIWNYRKKEELIARGVIKLDQVLESDINVNVSSGGLSAGERQWLQVRGIPKEKDKGGYYFDARHMQEQLRQWSYPLHMMDFETCTVAIPFFKGMRPYESVAFQYSHHVVYLDGKIEHRDQVLIAEPGDFPNFKFVRALKKSLETDRGSIFRWAAHENTILRHIKKQLLEYPNAPDDRDELVRFIDEITDSGPRSMIDLNELALRTFFHPETKGRTSIKQTLPAVMAVSQYLESKYSKPVYGSGIRSLNFPDGFAWYEREGGRLKDPYERLKAISREMLGDEAGTFSDAPEDVEITEGGAAAMAYARLQFEDLCQDHRARIEQALLRYCELDTFAMVMIVEAWREWASGRE